MATVLITGASSGLGEEFAWQLATARRNLVLVARSQDRLERTARLIRGATGVEVEVLVADLTVPADVARVATRVADLDRPIDLLINNAGLGQGKRFIDNSIESELAALDVMVRAVMVVTHAAVGAMRTRRRGAVLNVSSVASWLGSGTYSAHKAWLTAFTEGLSIELRGTGVTATAVLPGLTHTRFHDSAGIDSYDRLPDLAWLQADQVVAAALAAVRRKQVLVTPSLRYGMVAGVARVAPRAWVRAASRGVRL